MKERSIILTASDIKLIYRIIKTKTKDIKPKDLQDIDPFKFYDEALEEFWKEKDK